MAAGGHKAIIAAFLANLGIALAKFAGFFITGASSMLAEAVHSVADSGNQGLLLLGVARAQQPESVERPFGHGRERYFWAFIVALVLFLLGGLFAIYEGVHKLQHPSEIESVGWALGVLALGIALEANSFRVAVKEAAVLKGDRGWWSFIRHAKTPEIPVILLEDLGALAGLGIALVCVGIAALTGNPVWDAVGTLAIGLLLAAISIVLGIEMRSLLIGESASLAKQAQIRACIDGHPEVVRSAHLQTQHLGPDELLVAAKVELSPDASFYEVVRVIDEVEDQIRKAVPEARIIYLEPDAREKPAPT